MNSQLKATKLILTIVVSVLLFSFFIIVGQNLIKNFQYSDIITGGAVSTAGQGGNVTYVNASKINTSGHWQGYFGEITVDPSSQVLPSATAQGGNVSEVNLVLPCIGDEIYVSTRNNIILESVINGTKEAIDTFLNLSSSHLESGTKVFVSTSNFTVNSVEVTNVPTTFTLVSSSSSTTFDLGALNESNTLVFVSRISPDTIGFNGQSVDYQVMVPVNQSFLTYYFFSDCVAAPVVVPVTPSAPSAKAGKSLSPSKEIIVKLVIDVKEGEGKLLVTGYPIAITVIKGEKSQQQLQIRNTGDGDLTNIYVVVSGLPLDIFSISPGKYGLLQSGEKRDFVLEFLGNLETGTYDIQMAIISDQGSSIIDGVLIVKGSTEKKLPLVGAATGSFGNYEMFLFYLLLLLLLFLLAFALWHFLAKHRHTAYHTCTIEEILHHHEEGNKVQVSGILKPIGKSKELIFSRLTDKTGWIDVLADTAVKGGVQIKGIVQRDAEEHKYIKTIFIAEFLKKKPSKKKRT